MQAGVQQAMTATSTKDSNPDGGHWRASPRPPARDQRQHRRIVPTNVAAKLTAKQADDLVGDCIGDCLRVGERRHGGGEAAVGVVGDDLVDE